VPSRPVRILIAFRLARHRHRRACDGSEAVERLGQPVLVENPGRRRAARTELAAKAAPDGYTVFLRHARNLSVTLLYPKLPFDIGRDFAPLTQVVSTTFMLYVNPSCR